MALSTLLISALLIATFIGLVAGIVQLFKAQKQLVALRAKLAVQRSRIQKRRLEVLEMRNRARLLEDTVKNGTTAVEKMHKTIASTTFSLIDHFAKDETFRENARRARDSHDNTSAQIYQAARTTNRAFHVIADTLFISRREKKLTTRKKPSDSQ